MHKTKSRERVLQIGNRRNRMLAKEKKETRAKKPKRGYRTWIFQAKRLVKKDSSTGKETSKGTAHGAGPGNRKLEGRKQEKVESERKDRPANPSIQLAPSFILRQSPLRHRRCISYLTEYIRGMLVTERATVHHRPPGARQARLVMHWAVRGWPSHLRRRREVRSCRLHDIVVVGMS